MRRRELLIAVAAVSATGARAAPLRPLTVYKADGCTCCEGWISAMSRAGFAPTVIKVTDLSREWRKRGVPDRFSSCHMGVASGYVLVGHVPPADAIRLLKERPKAIGLTVPGMPDGSPGMERPDGVKDPYDTLLLLPGGGHRIWARHA